jgi:hypothetical protein
LGGQVTEHNSTIDSRDHSLLRNGRLSIRKVLLRAAISLIRNAVPILLAMLAPVMILTLIGEFFLTNGVPWSASVVALSVVTYVAFILLWVGFASVLHARFLDRRERPPLWRVLIWSRTQLDFLIGILKVLGLIVLMNVVVVVAAVVAGPLAQLIGVLAASFVWARLSMVFPGASVGRPLALEDSWSLTSNARGRVVILLGSLYLVAQIFVPMVLGLVLFFGSNWYIEAAVAALMFGGAAVVAAVLSATYQALVEMRPQHVRDTYIPEDGSRLADTS